MILKRKWKCAVCGSDVIYHNRMLLCDCGRVEVSESIRRSGNFTILRGESK